MTRQVKESAKRVSVGFKEVGNAVGSYSAHAHRSIGVDNSLVFDEFRKDFIAGVLPSTADDTFLFELIGIDAPIANAIRRILLAEVPTVAIETVYVHDNSTVMPDEMLAQRLGLVPLDVDPRKLEMRKHKDDVTAKNTVKFRLRSQCARNSSSAPRDGIARPEDLYTNSSVTTGSIEYVPFDAQDQDGQLLDLNFSDKPKPVHDDIVVVKMRPGQRVHVEMDAVKSIGRDHAKFSPVATASYRMLPEVELKEPVSGAQAHELVKKCPMNVFDIEDSGSCVVARPSQCTMCRECIREPEWNDLVSLSRKRDHFIFSVETTGALPAPTLVDEALSILYEKCKTVEAGLEEALQRLKSSATGKGDMGFEDDDGDDDDDVDAVKDEDVMQDDGP